MPRRPDGSPDRRPERPPVHRPDGSPDLRAVEAADVYKGERLAATLRRDGDDVVFAYDEDYLADLATPPVAWSLPKRTAPVRTTAGAVPPFFAGLLPEGVRLQALVGGVRTSIDDHLTLLLAVGEDTVGDVRVVPAGAVPGEPSVVLDERYAGSADLVGVFARAVSTDPATLANVALPGVQVKVSAAMLSTPVRTTVGPAILKLNPPTGHPRLVENEHFFLSLAAAAGIPVPAHRLLHDATGQAALLVARFDRTPPRTTRDAPRTTHDAGQARFQRLAQEDACQVMGVYPASKYRLRTEHVAGALADAVVAGGGSRLLALRRIFELVVFSYLMGNGDLHGKNLSIHQSAAGVWEVTPGYDLLSTQPYAGWGDPMALDLYGRANRLTREHLLDAAARLGLPARAARRTLDGLAAAVEAGLPRLGEIGLPDRPTQLLGRLITTRVGEVTGGSS